MTTIQPIGPKLILHFDVNKTLINSDSVSGKDREEILINQAAEDIIYKWDENLPEMSYKAYVKSFLVPGNDSDSSIKKQRREAILQFLEKVKEFPEVADRAHKYYQQLKESATDSVFRSFVKLIKKLKEQQFSFVVILRTFGNDLKEVENEISKTTGISFSKRGEFKEGVLHLEGDENKTISKTNELFQFFANSNDHISIRDSYKDWNGNGEKAMNGKRFIFDRNATDLSLMFDDNLTGDSVKDIVAPYSQEGDFVPTNELLGKILFPVHTGQAMLNENYFIELVNRGLRENGHQIQIL